MVVPPPSGSSSTASRGCVRLLLPAQAGNVSVVRRVVEGLSREVGFEPPRRADVRLAVTEACSNVVRHAYTDEAGDLEVWMRVTDESLQIDVLDRGPGIAPRSKPTSLGLGLPLIAAVTDALRITRERDGANVLSMTFRSAPSALGSAAA